MTTWVLGLMGRLLARKEERKVQFPEFSLAGKRKSPGVFFSLSLSLVRNRQRLREYEIETPSAVLKSSGEDAR